MRKCIKAIIFSAVMFLLFFATVSPCSAYYFKSYDVGGTTYYTGDVTGRSYDVGSTTYYNVGGKSFSSYKVGDTTYYSGLGAGSKATSVGDTTYYNIDGLRTTSSEIGGTTYYSGDVTGKSYDVGGTTYSQMNVREPVQKPVPIPTYPSYPVYYPSSNSPYLLRLYQLGLYSKILTELQKTQPKVQTQTYGGQNGEPVFTSKEAYEYWLKVKNHPAETLSSTFDYGAEKDRAITADRGIPNIISINAVGEGKIRLTWSAVNGAEKYYVFYGPSSGGYIYQTSTGSSLSHEVGGLPVGQRYYFAIQAQMSISASNRTWGLGNDDFYSAKGKEASVVVQ